MTDEEAANFYGSDATEWLKRWDEGRIVHTIEMGGLGPGYEQCIHIICAEILRHMLAQKYDVAAWDASKEQWHIDRDVIDKAVMAIPHIKDLGMSGAQWGAAMNIAGHLYRHGPAHVMQDEQVKDRHIQVQRTFPSVAQAG